MRRSSNPGRQFRIVSNGQQPGQESPQPPVADENEANGSLRRKGSFSFLRRSKSRERSASGPKQPSRKLSKKDRTKARDEGIGKEQVPQKAPRVPLVPRPADLPTFGGEDTRPDSASIMSNRAEGSYQRRLAQKSSQEFMGSDVYRGMPIPPVPPIPAIPGMTPVAGSRPPPNYDPYARTESMTHRGRYSYASSAISTINSPRKVRRRNDPTPFNILVLGARGSGKTSFLNFLRDTLTPPVSRQRQHSVQPDEIDIPPSVSGGAFPSFTSQYLETKIDSESIGVTLWDSDGLESNVVDLQLKEITSFIESKFEDTFTEESKIARAPGVRDTHIHCTFLVLDPRRLDANIAAQLKAKQINGVKAKANSFAKNRPEPTPSGLDENVDINVLRALKGKTTVVPIIAKADTATSAHMSYLKRAVWDSLKKNGLDSLEALEQGDDDDEENSDASTIDQILDERDEDNAALAISSNDSRDPDKFSTTSHLDTGSDDSEFSASDFDLAKPGRPTITNNRNASNLGITASQERTAASAPPTNPFGLPFSILSPDPYEPDIVGRRYPWGYADPLNSEHCDFTRLKSMVFSEWRADLKTASTELWYEDWRTSRLNKKSRRNGTISLGVNEVRPTIWSPPM